MKRRQLLAGNDTLDVPNNLKIHCDSCVSISLTLPFSTFVAILQDFHSHFDEIKDCTSPSVIQPWMQASMKHTGSVRECLCSYLGVVLLILLKHLDDQLSKANSVLQFLGRSNQASHILWRTKVMSQHEPFPKLHIPAAVAMQSNVYKVNPRLNCVPFEWNKC